MNDSWFLGTGKSPMSPVYGSLVPLSNSKNDLWVKKCARCNKGLNHDLTASPHRPIPTGGQTMWLAKLYVNDLLLTWKTDPSTMSRRPSVACAAQGQLRRQGSHALHLLHRRFERQGCRRQDGCGPTPLSHCR